MSSIELLLFKFLEAMLCRCGHVAAQPDCAAACKRADCAVAEDASRYCGTCS